MEINMRRKDREIVDANKIDEIIKSCQYCRLGFYDAENDEVYVLPMNFGFIKKSEQRLFYFHCAKEGRKLDLLLKNGKVGFELDCGYRLNEGEKACDYSAAFQSVIGNGTLSIVNEIDEKIEGMQSVMLGCSGRGDWEFDTRMMEITCILKLTIEKLSCKEHL